MLWTLHIGFPQVFVVGLFTWTAWGLTQRTTFLSRQDPIKYNPVGCRSFKALVAVFYVLLMSMLYWGGFFG
jgi:hypothetical protein